VKPKRFLLPKAASYLLLSRRQLIGKGTCEMKKPPLKTIRDIANILKNPPYRDVAIMCDTIVRMCEDFLDTPYAKPFAKLSVVANALRGKSVFELKSITDTMLKQCANTAQDVADITKQTNDPAKES
jgi:hypothetical protein